MASSTQVVNPGTPPAVPIQTNEETGSLMSRAVKWFRQTDEWETARKILAVALFILLSATIVGFIITIPAAIEWNQQASFITNSPIITPTSNASSAVKSQNSDLLDTVGKFADYYTANKTLMKTFLTGIGCVLEDDRFTKKGPDFLKEEEYSIKIPATKDFHNDEEVTLTVKSSTIQKILDSVNVMTSSQLSPEKYVELLNNVPSSLNLDDAPIDPDSKLSYRLYATQVCHSIRVPLLTTSFKTTSGLAHQQLKSACIDDAPEIILLSSVGFNFTYKPEAKVYFIKDNKIQDNFREYVKGMWEAHIMSAIQQKATDLSLLPIGGGVFIDSLKPNEIKNEILKIYLETLREILDTEEMSKQFPHGAFFSKGKVPENLVNEAFKGCKTPIFVHGKDAANLAQAISSIPGRTCGLSNPSDADVIFKAYNVGEYWQDSKQGTSRHVGEEFLMHFLLGMLGSYEMREEPFLKPITTKDVVLNTPNETPPPDNPSTED